MTVMKRKKTLIDRGESFPCFKCPVDSIFEETQERFLEHMVNTNLKPLFQSYIHYWSRLM